VSVGSSGGDSLANGPYGKELYLEEEFEFKVTYCEVYDCSSDGEFSLYDQSN
jgi:hypothetical protein